MASGDGQRHKSGMYGFGATQPKRSKDMSKYEFLPGDKVLIKGREDTGEWEVLTSHWSTGAIRAATLTRADSGVVRIDRSDLIRVGVDLATGLQLEVDNARLKEKIAHLDDRIRHRDKLIDDQRRKTSHLDDSIDHQDKVITEQRSKIKDLEWMISNQGKLLRARAAEIEDLRRKTLLDAGEINAQRDTIREQRQRRINERECRGSGLYIRAFLGEEL